MADNGWIKLHRQILSSDWFTDVNTNHLFIYCVLRANFEPASWRGIELKRGQFVTSLKTLSIETGLSVQQVRTSINKLISTRNITSKASNKNTIISVLSYDKYQDTNTHDNKQITNEKQTDNKQITTDKNIITKEEKELKNNTLGFFQNPAEEVSIIEKQFDEFWRCYPTNGRRKGDRKPALEKFKVAIKKDSIENIAAGLKRYSEYLAASDEKNKDAKSWLYNECWKSDYGIKRDVVDASVDVDAMEERFRQYELSKQGSVTNENI